VLASFESRPSGGNRGRGRCRSRAAPVLQADASIPHATPDNAGSGCALPAGGPGRHGGTRLAV